MTRTENRVPAMLDKLSLVDTPASVDKTGSAMVCKGNMKRTENRAPAMLDKLSLVDAAASVDRTGSARRI